MKFDAVIFDCDGVLVDSEQLSAAVLRDMFEEMGLVMTHEEVARHFLGKTMKDEFGWISERTGAVVDERWLEAFRVRRNAVLHAQLEPVPGAPEAVAILHAALDRRIACASGGDRVKIELQLAKVGLIDYFRGRTFSGYEMPRSKPAPDVYLAAIEALQVKPRRCMVVEDSVTGVQAGVAAGAAVYGYCGPGSPAGSAQALLAAGAAVVFHDMRSLPLLVGVRPS